MRGRLKLPQFRSEECSRVLWTLVLKYKSIIYIGFIYPSVIYNGSNSTQQAFQGNFPFFERQKDWKNKCSIAPGDEIRYLRSRGNPTCDH